MKKIWQTITALKNAIGNLLFIAFIALVLITLIGQESDGIPASAVMILDPEGVIVEQLRPIDPIEEFLLGDESENAEKIGRAHV